MEYRKAKLMQDILLFIYTIEPKYKLKIADSEPRDKMNPIPITYLTDIKKNFKTYEEIEISSAIRTLGHNKHIEYKEDVVMAFNLSQEIIMTTDGVAAMQTNYYITEYYKSDKLKADSVYKKLPITISLLALVVSIYNTCATNNVKPKNLESRLEAIEAKLSPQLDSVYFHSKQTTRQPFDTIDKKH